MKFASLAGLVLAAVLCANTATAGFIPIDSFDGVNPGNIYLTATPSAGLATGAGTLGTVGPTVGATTMDYTFNNVNLGGFSTLKLLNVAKTNGTFAIFADVVNNGASLGLVQGTVSGSNYLFAFTAPLDDVESIQFTFGALAGSYTFSAGALQAVPEPTTLALIGLVSAGGGIAGWRKRRKAVAV